MPDQHPRTVEASAAVPDLPSILCIGIGSLSMIAFMAQHPSVESSGMADMVEEMARKAALSRLVHGALIVVMVLVFHGLMGFVEILGRHLGRVRAGTIAYAVGMGCMIGAALINGFVTAGIASSYAGRSAAELDLLRPVLQLSGEIGRTLAQTGTMALSAAVFAWSCVLLRRNRFACATGVLGLIVGVLPVLGLLSGHLHLHVHGMAGVVFAQAAWSLCVAVWLFGVRSKSASTGFSSHRAGA